MCEVSPTWATTKEPTPTNKKKEKTRPNPTLEREEKRKLRAALKFLKFSFVFHYCDFLQVHPQNDPLRFFCPIDSKWPRPSLCQTTGSREKERRSCGPAKFGRALAQRPMTSRELSFSCGSMRSTTILASSLHNWRSRWTSGFICFEKQ